MLMKTRHWVALLAVGCGGNDGIEVMLPSGPGASVNAQASECAPGWRQCSGTCVDSLTDSTNCGACGTVCPSGLTCVAGQCRCRTELRDCGDVCVDVSSNGMHCGGCNLECQPGQVCSGGLCGSTCSAGETQCGTSCVDTFSDSQNCGACHTACADQQSCVGGECTCANPREVSCGGVCADLSSDPNHCGDCSWSCAGGALCLDGTCTVPEGAAGAGGAPGGTPGPTGGVPTGGISSATGGEATGGVRSTGGVPTGGAVTGGADTGGALTGGAATGGAPTGGAATGGADTGGAATGGASTGGATGEEPGTCSLMMPGATGDEPDGQIPVCCTPEAAEQSLIDEAFSLLNAHRASNGVSALAYDTELQDAIQGHCVHMAVHSFFDHTAPESSVSDPFERAELCGARASGENIAMGQRSPSEVTEGWARSSGHNRNMLDSGFTRVGIGYEDDGRYWGQIFGD